jgi:hypothetical protein
MKSKVLVKFLAEWKSSNIGSKKTINEKISILEDRFTKNIRIEDKSGCWEWTGFIRDYGYGGMYVGGKVFTASRLSYMIHKGDIPKGLFVCHSCDKPICVNPDHLWAGTHSENMKDMVEKGRASKGKYLLSGKCKRGHLFKDGTIRIRSNGRRECVPCSRERSRQYTKRMNGGTV